MDGLLVNCEDAMRYGKNELIDAMQDGLDKRIRYLSFTPDKKLWI